MDILKRTGEVLAVPFAVTWFLGTSAIGLPLFVAGCVPASLYASGKYIVTGKSGSFDRYFESTFLRMVDIASYPFVDHKQITPS